MEHPAEAKDRSLLGKCTWDGINTALIYSEDLARVVRGSFEPERPRQTNLGCLEPYRESTTQLLDLGRVSARHGSPRLASSISYISRQPGTCLQGHCLDAERAHQPDLSRLCRGWKTRSSLPPGAGNIALSWAGPITAPPRARLACVVLLLLFIARQQRARFVGTGRGQNPLCSPWSLGRGPASRGARGGHAATTQVPAASRETLKLSTL